MYTGFLVINPGLNPRQSLSFPFSFEPVFCKHVTVYLRPGQVGIAICVRAIHSQSSECACKDNFTASYRLGT